MLLRQMQYFLAAAACKSFGQAAKLCYVSQPAFSLQIKNLEKELGVKLINRNNHSFALTPAGEKFLGPCKKIVGEVDVLKKNMEVFSQDLLPPQFTIGCRRNYNLHRLMNIVNDINGSDAGYHLKIVYGDYNELWDMLQHGEIDMLVSDERDDDYSALNSELIESSSLNACFPPSSELAAQQFVDTNELSGFRCVIIADKEFQIQESEYVSRLLNFHGSFSIAKDVADSVVYISDTCSPSFYPLPSNSCAPNFYNKYTKIVPLLKNGEPIIIRYKLFWPKKHKKITPIAQKIFQLMAEPNW